MRMTVSEMEDERVFNHSRCGGPISAMRSEGQPTGGPTIQYRGTNDKGKKLWQVLGMCGACGKEGWFQNYPEGSSNHVDMRRPMYGKPRPKR